MTSTPSMRISLPHTVSLPLLRSISIFYQPPTLRLSFLELVSGWQPRRLLLRPRPGCPLRPAGRHPRSQREQHTSLLCRDNFTDNPQPRPTHMAVSPRTLWLLVHLPPRRRSSMHPLQTPISPKVATLLKVDSSLPLNPRVATLQLDISIPLSLPFPTLPGHHQWLDLLETLLPWHHLHPSPRIWTIGTMFQWSPRCRLESPLPASLRSRLPSPVS
jgi:hypothetical protein